MDRLEALTDLCAELNNYFCDEDEDAVRGKFEISSGTISPAVSLLTDQYYRISGSVFNDGVHINDGTSLKDEPEFCGTVFKMRIPLQVIRLADEIAAWRDKNESVDSANMSPFQSESFGIYSYSKGSSGQSKNGGAGATAVRWQNQFAAELNKYRRLWGI